MYHGPAKSLECLCLVLLSVTRQQREVWQVHVPALDRALNCTRCHVHTQGTHAKQIRPGKRRTGTSSLCHTSHVLRLWQDIVSVIAVEHVTANDITGLAYRAAGAWSSSCCSSLAAAVQLYTGEGDTSG